MRRFLTNGAPITAYYHGLTPLHAVCESNGVDSSDAITLLLHNGADINAKDNRGWTPIYMALYFGHNNSVRTLLERGANVHVQNRDGRTPLHLAIDSGNRGDDIELLLDYGANVNKQDRDGRTSLHDAVIYDKYEYIKILLNNGADINIKDHRGQTPFDLAEGETIQFLHEYCNPIKEPEEL
jgi:ankyrin repeat protein